MPSPVDLIDLPFLREALLEIVLLAVSGGVLGAWIVLRRLAFYSHAVGSATFPGLVTADAIGDQRHAAGAGRRARLRGRRGRDARPAGSAREAATGLLLVAALALGVVLASDVFESGAGVDRLLFGTLLGLGSTDLAISRSRPPARGRRSRPRSLRPRAGPRSGSTPTAPARSACAPGSRGPGAAGTRGARGRGGLPAVGALLVAAVFVVPAAAARLLAHSVRGLLVLGGGAGARRGRVGLYLAYWLDVPPGPPIAVLGARSRAWRSEPRPRRAVA